MIPVDHWSVSGRRLELAGGVLVGVLNVTPDSFSDGGDTTTVSAALVAARDLTSDGARVVDIGGESTRPGAMPVPVEVESERVLPVLDGLAGSEVTVSVDTYEPLLARRALDAGAHIINDITGFADRAMIDVVADTDCGVVVMCGRDAVLEDGPDLVDQVERHLMGRVERLVDAGVRNDRIVIDPGLGFAKSPPQSLTLLAEIGRLARHGLPVMIGASRKGFLSTIPGVDSWADRDRATATISAVGYAGGARVFRVHDVARSRDALRVADAIVTSH